MNLRQIKEDKLINDALSAAAGQFKGEAAVNSFIQQVLTEKERLAVGRRIVIARLILTGATYYEVNEILQISPNTFRNIRQWISKELPSYRDVKDKQKKPKSKKSSGSRNRVSPLSFTDLKSRYPMHFLLFSIADNILLNKDK